MMFSMIAMGWLMLTASPLHASDGKAIYMKACRICHGNGSAGAPKAGDAAAWQTRAAKGKEVLYDHAINGFRAKGFMPPKGGNKRLTDEEVKAAVDYMLQLVQ